MYVHKYIYIIMYKTQAFAVYIYICDKCGIWAETLLLFGLELWSLRFFLQQLQFPGLQLRPSLTPRPVVLDGNHMFV
jgi:hypothetical protein